MKEQEILEGLKSGKYTATLHNGHEIETGWDFDEGEVNADLDCEIVINDTDKVTFCLRITGTERITAATHFQPAEDAGSVWNAEVDGQLLLCTSDGEEYVEMPELVSYIEKKYSQK